MEMKKRTLALLFLFAFSIMSYANEPLLRVCESTDMVNVNDGDDDEKSLIENPRFLHMNNYRIISGPELKKYAISILTLPDVTYGGMSTLEYMKLWSKLIYREGDCWGNKYECTILAEIEDDEIYRYILIVESMDDEFMAKLSSAMGHGGFEEVIYTVINYPPNTK